MERYKNRYIEYLFTVKGVTREYTGVVKHHINKVLYFLNEKGIKNIEDASRSILSEFQDTIMRKPLAKATKIDILRAVSLFFRYLHDYDYIKENPGLIIEPPKLGYRIPRNIMNEEEIKFLMGLPNKESLLEARDLCIMKLLYSTAMRTKELFNIKLEDMDLKRKHIIVKRTKNKRDRIVHFDTYSAKHLADYIKKTRPWLLQGGKSDKLFISATGSDLKRGSWAVYFSKKYAPPMKTKFKKHITPYSFRHSSATHWLDTGTKQKRDVLPYIQRHLGHESLESTAIYTHVAIESLREMFKRYHPREKTQKNINRIPTPDDIISGGR